MSVKDLSAETFARIQKMRYDRIIEKHEGPETWNWQFHRDDPDMEGIIQQYKESGVDYEPESDAEFLEIGGCDVLLPVSADHHPNITVLHHFLSRDETKLVVYLKDTTYDDTAWGAGFVAICDRFPDENFYITTFFHEWFIIDYDPLADRWKE